ncbi:hypothetical protein D3C72_2307760 [compost metagenome]
MSELHEAVHEMGDGGSHRHHLAHAHSVHADPSRVAQAIEDHDGSDCQRCGWRHVIAFRSPVLVLEFFGYVGRDFAHQEAVTRRQRGLWAEAFGVQNTQQ